MKLAVALVTMVSLTGPVLAEQLTFAPMAMNSLSSIPANIASAPVMDQSGAVIGKVQRVLAGYDGRPTAMSYTTRDGRLVLMASQAVSYDGQRHLLITQDSPQRLASR